MKRVELEQDSQAWLDFKRSRIGGSGAKDIAVPLARGADRTPAGFWDLIAGMLTRPAEINGEDPRDRGHRLETDCIEELETIVGQKFNSKPTPWVSDEDDALMLSSDACEPVEVPTYDAEIKSFSKWGKHFKLIYKLRSYTGRNYDLLDFGHGSDFRHQIVHGFVVNPKLEVRYFVSYCPEAIYQEHRIVVLPIYREELDEEIGELREYEIKALIDARRIVGELVGDNF